MRLIIYISLRIRIIIDLQKYFFHASIEFLMICRKFSLAVAAEDCTLDILDCATLGLSHPTTRGQTHLLLPPRTTQDRGQQAPLFT